MKSVENPGGFVFRPDLKPAAGHPGQARKRAGGASFLSIFRSADDGEESRTAAGGGDGLDPAQLEAQVDRIHELGQGLLKLQTLEQVKAYKAAVKALLDHFVRNGLEAAEMVSNRSVLNQKKYTIVKVIDDKLEKLVTGILQSQVRQLDVLAKLEEIQGLLVDLIH
jgi:uncharacterized protein YaaR (DUF327 family)